MKTMYIILKKNVILLVGAKDKEQSDGRIGRNLEWAPKVVRAKIFI